jgi:hypothetical protein
MHPLHLNNGGPEVDHVVVTQMISRSGFPAPIHLHV